MELRDRKKIINLKGNLAKYEDGTPGLYYSNSFVEPFTAPDVNDYTTTHLNKSPLDIVKSNLGQNKSLIGSSFDNTITKDADVKGVTNKSTAPSAAGVANAAVATLGAGMTIADTFKYDKTSNMVYNQGDKREGNIGGIGYDYTDVDGSSEMREVNKSVKSGVLGAAGAGAAAGGAIGSIIPGVGTAIGAVAGGVIGAIGGLFGGSAKKRKAMLAIKDANDRAYAMKNFNRDGALTEAMRLQNARETGPFNQTYKFKDGKLPGFNDGKSVHTALGSVKTKQNSWGSAGETIVDTLTGAYHTIPGKPNFKDTYPMYARGRDAVLSNHGASQYFQSTKDLEGALMMDNLYRSGGMTNFRNGKMPGFKGGFEGPWSNIIPSAFGMLAGAKLYFDAKNQDIRTPNIYSGNRYETDALATLNELKENPLPTLNLLRDAEARTNSAIAQSGGLSAAQRLLSRASTLNTTQNNMAKYLAQVQALNNAYKQAYATTALLTGAQNAQRKMAANQFAEDMTAKAHAARLQGMQVGISNALAQLQNYYANEFKRNQFNETLGLYKDQLLLDRDKFTADWNNRLQNGNTLTRNTFIPTPSLWWDAFLMSNRLDPYTTRQNYINNYTRFNGFR